MNRCERSWVGAKSLRRIRAVLLCFTTSWKNATSTERLGWFICNRRKRICDGSSAAFIVSTELISLLVLFRSVVSFGSKNRAIGVSAKNQVGRVGRFLAFVRNSKSASANRSGTSGCKESWLAVVKMKNFIFRVKPFILKMLCYSAML